MENAALWIGIGLAGLFGAIGIYWIAIRLTLSELPRTSEILKVPTADGWTLRLCRYRGIDTSGPPVILCHGIMANQFSLTAPKGDSLVDVLVERGYDCWVMDARGTRSSAPPTGRSRYDAKASDYALQDMPAIIEFVQSKTGYGKVHWIGHSMGGMMLYMYLAAFGSGAIASGTTLGSPPGLDHFKPQRLGGLLFLSGLMPVVVEFIWRCNSVLFKLLKVNSKLAPINWANMDPRVTAATFFNMVEFLPYPAANELTGWIKQKRWTIREGAIDVGAFLPNMDAPLLLVYGAIDWFTPLEKAQALYDALPKRDKRLLILGRSTGCLNDYSHVDLVFARRGRAELYEPISAWLAAHPVKKGAAAPRVAHETKSGLELEQPAPTRQATKAAPRPKRKKTAQAASARTETRPATQKATYATQKKVARKKKAAKQTKKTVGLKPKPGAKSKSGKKTKPSAAKRKTNARPTKKKPAKRKR